MASDVAVPVPVVDAALVVVALELVAELVAAVCWRGCSSGRLRNIVRLALGQKAALRALDTGVRTIPQRLRRVRRPDEEVPPWRRGRRGLDAG